MNLSQNGINLIKKFEGCKLASYQDIVGVWTIGFGFTKGVGPNQIISMSECESRLLSEVREYEAAVLRACTIAPSQCQFDALVSLAWNIGIAGMSSSSVVRYHNKKDFVNAAKSFSMWNKAGGKVVQGLVNRREAEATLYLS